MRTCVLGVPPRRCLVCGQFFLGSALLDAGIVPVWTACLPSNPPLTVVAHALIQRVTSHLTLLLFTPTQVIRIQPNESIYLKINNKVPGLGLRVENTRLDLTYGSRYQTHLPGQRAVGKRGAGIRVSKCCERDLARQS